MLKEIINILITVRLATYDLIHNFLQGRPYIPAR